MEVSELFRFISSSSIRTSVIFSLLDAPKPIRALQGELGTSPSVVAHTLSDLENEGLVAKKAGSRCWQLTNTGRIAAITIKKSRDIFEVLEKFRTFFEEHDLSWLEEDFVIHLDKLKNAELFVYDGVSDPHQRYLEEVRKARWVRAVSGMILPEYRELYPWLVEKGVDMELVLTPEILEVTAKVVEELYGLSVGEYLKRYPNVKVYVIDFRPSIAFTVTDSYFSFGCFTPEGIYDLSTDIMAWDEEARRFGLMLFERYRSMAREFKG